MTTDERLEQWVIFAQAALSGLCVEEALHNPASAIATAVGEYADAMLAEYEKRRTQLGEADRARI